MKYGIQMYSVRDYASKDLFGALDAVAGIGYKYIEFAGFFGADARDVKKRLDSLGLVASGTHTGWDKLANDYEATVKYHKEIGCNNIIIPGADLSTEAKLDDFIGFLNDVIPKLATDGMTLGYHNHSGEFLPTQYGKIIHNELEKRTDVEFEIDTYWAYFAGEDPIALLKRLSGRVRVIHLKDGIGREGKSLGEGNAPVGEVLALAKSLGLLCVVESESLKPDGISEVTRCFDYLKQQI